MSPKVPLVATLAAALVLVGGRAPLNAQQAPLVIARRASQITLDGRPDEPAWREATPLPLVMHLPTFGAEPTQRTDAWITYDDRYIYVAARLYDTAPDAIQAMSLARDEDIGGDFFNVMLDPYNDNENGHSFSTTPAGARLDYAVANDAEGPTAASIAWNGVWDNAVHRDSTGWSAEVRIPFSTLRYETRDGRTVMGLIVNRLIGRTQERDVFPPIAPDRPFAAFKPSRARDVEFRGVPERRPLHVTPYAAVGGTRWPGADASRGRGDIGLDLRYGVANNVNLDLTVNTDFAEAEGDDERVNLTRFPLFFPERRQFFLERAGVFDFGQGDVDRLFHSRRIGLTPAGEPVRLLGGARVVARLGGWDFALLSLQAARTDSSPSENLAVARARRRVLNEYSAIGAMLTSRLATDGSRDLGFGLDGTARLSRHEDFLRVTWARTAAQPADTAVGGSSGDEHFRVQLGRRSTRGVSYGAIWTLVGDGYEPRLGFVERRGTSRADAGAAFGVPVQKHRWLRLIRPSLGGTVVWSDSDRTVASSLIAARWRMESRTGAFAELGRDQQGERLTAPFDLSGTVSVPAGNYAFGTWTAALGLPPGWRLRGQVTAQAGDYYDGQLTAVTVAPLWLPSPHFNLGVEYQRISGTFAIRAQRWTADVVRVRTRVYANAHLSTAVFAQYNSDANVVTTNVRLRYAFREGTDLWIVVNHATPARRALPITVAEQTGVMVKYTYMLGR